MCPRSTLKAKDSDIWTPWVGKRDASGDKDREIWTPWVGKRSGGGGLDFKEEEMDEYDNDEGRNLNTWVYPLPQNI